MSDWLKKSHEEFMSMIEDDEAKRVLGMYLSKGKQFRHETKEKLPKLAKPMPKLHKQVDEIERTLKALRGLLGLFEQYPDAMQETDMQKMSYTLHKQVSVLITMILNEGGQQ